MLMTTDAKAPANNGCLIAICILVVCLFFLVIGLSVGSAFRSIISVIGCIIALCYGASKIGS